MIHARTVAVLIGAAWLATACATGGSSRTVVREVEDASIVSATRLQRVAVVAIDADAGPRKAWEDALAAQLARHGVMTTTGEGLRSGASIDAGAPTVDGSPVIEAARRSGAEAILFVQPPAAVPVAIGSGAYRWLAARSSPDPRTDLDTTPASVTELRLYNLETNKGVWRALVMVYYPAGGAADAGKVADATASALAKRGFVRAGGS